MKVQKAKPPAPALWILRQSFPEHDDVFLHGDFKEIYRDTLERKGKTAAVCWIWSQVFLSIPRFIHHAVFWRLIMLSNTMKITFRNINKYKGYSFINIAGLAMGMAISILILLWVHHELSFDRFHEKKDRIYRILQKIQYSEIVTWAINQGPLAPALMEEVPEIEEAVRYESAGFRFKVGDDVFIQYGAMVDPAFLEVFSFPLIKGDPATALSEPHSIVITEELAETMFGREDPINQYVTVVDTIDLKVTGILKNIPDNSHLNFNYLTTMELAKQLGWTVEIWTNSTFNTYVLLRENVSEAQAEEKIYNFLDDKPTLEDWEKLTLQPLTDIHLSSGIGYENAITTPVQYVYIFFIAALFLLVIACINFMNLSTARSTLRSKEVGLRKVVGAYRVQLISQFLGESGVLAVLAFIVSLGLIVLLLGVFNQLSGKHFTLAVLLNPSILLGVLAIVLFTGFLAGSYPALFLSSFRPVEVLKASQKTGSASSFFRKALVVFQFSISIILLIGTLIIHRQVSYLQNRDIGYDRENLVWIRASGNMRQQFESFKHELESHPNILKTGSSRSMPHYGYTFSNARWSWEGKDPEKDVLFRCAYIDDDYIDTFGMRMSAGRSFSKMFASDSNAIIVNEKALKAMGLEDPVGKIMTYSWREGYPFRIVGIVEDFNFRSLRTEIEPLAFLMMGGSFGNSTPSFVFARIRPENIKQTIEYMETVWDRFETKREFDYGFVDENFERLYRAEERIGRLFQTFTILAGVISCFGLFGLASFMTVRRTKEIGIRKVLGASSSGLVYILVREFTKWILVANLISWPIAYFTLKAWLRNFAYRTPISLWLFALTGVLTLGVAVLTVIYQAARAATSDPVKSLRYE